MDARPKADSKKLKTRKCRVCRAAYTPIRPLQSACGTVCALALAQARRERDTARAAREDRKQTRAQLLDLKPLSYWRDRAQREFNRWIRLRDSGLACVSCGRHHVGKVNAGHYLSRGARPELAFEPLNVHLQCEPCNTNKGGNVALYRIELVKRIGADLVAWLEGPHEPLRYRREDYEAIEADFRARANALEKGRLFREQCREIRRKATGGAPEHA
jgi:hypothetical protein